jgi:FKBP-type peptidyl-prolyl cis-trans isomerase
MMQNNIPFLFFCLMLIFTSCKQKQATKPMPTQEDLQMVNKKIAHEKSQEIDAYVARHDWDVQKTGTGLRYFIYEHGGGVKIEKGTKTVFEFSLSLLDGKVIIERNKPEKRTIIVEKEDAEPGIHEVLQLMQVGDRAKIILPPHLAFGLTGTEEVPPYSTLVYDVKIISIE